MTQSLSRSGRVRYLLLILLVALLGCREMTSTGDGKVVARVYDHELYRQDIAPLIPEGTTNRDSLIIAENFIKNWVQQQLILQKASENLTNEEQDFSRELEEYENSLIIYTYESKLVEEYLDTLVSEEEIARFYEENSQNFELKEPVMRFSYVMLKEDLPEVEIFRNFIRSDDPVVMEKLDSLCVEYADEYWLGDEWVYFNDVIDKIPFEISDANYFLQRNKNIQVQEDNTWYLLSIREYRLAGSISPLELEEENIRKIIINNRKLELKKNLRKDLMQAAIDKNEVVIY
jgi:hypothetical protein